MKHPRLTAGSKDTHVIDHRHEALKALLEGNILHKLRRSPQSILDLAAGNGAWAVDVAQEFPTADEVVGVDIRRATPANHPPNCRFEVSLPNVRFVDDRPQTSAGEFAIPKTTFPSSTLVRCPLSSKTGHAMWLRFSE